MYSSYKKTIRMSREYLYGIWQCKILSIKEHETSFERKLIGTIWVVCKDNIKGKCQQKIPHNHIKCTQQLWYRNINANVDHYTGGKWYKVCLSPKECARYKLRYEKGCWMVNWPNRFPYIPGTFADILSQILKDIAAQIQPKGFSLLNKFRVKIAP